MLISVWILIADKSLGLNGNEVSILKINMGKKRKGGANVRIINDLNVEAEYWGCTFHEYVV